MDSAGDVYVVDFKNHRVQKSPQRRIVPMFGERQNQVDESAPKSQRNIYPEASWYACQAEPPAPATANSARPGRLQAPSLPMPPVRAPRSTSATARAAGVRTQRQLRQELPLPSTQKSSRASRPRPAATSTSPWTAKTKSESSIPPEPNCAKPSPAEQPGCAGDQPRGRLRRGGGNWPWRCTSSGRACPRPNQGHPLALMS